MAPNENTATATTGNAPTTTTTPSPAPSQQLPPLGARRARSEHSGDDMLKKSNFCFAGVCCAMTVYISFIVTIVIFSINYGEIASNIITLFTGKYLIGMSLVSLLIGVIALCHACVTGEGPFPWDITRAERGRRRKHEDYACATTIWLAVFNFLGWLTMPSNAPIGYFNIMIVIDVFMVLFGAALIIEDCLYGEYRYDRDAEYAQSKAFKV